MTIAAAKIAVERARNRYGAAFAAWTIEPEVTRARQALKRAEAEAQAKNAHKVEEARAALVEAENALRELQDSRKKEIPPTVAAFLKRAEHGVRWGGKFLCRWLSPCGNFAIITRTGHSWYANRMQGHAYALAKHWLIDLRLGTDQNGTRAMDRASVEECEGKLNKETIAAWKAKAQPVCRARVR